MNRLRVEGDGARAETDTDTEAGKRPARSDRRGWVAAASLIVVAAVVGGLAAGFDAVFMVNDDAAMASFASGTYTGDPAAHLVYIGVFPGLILAGLYRFFPNVPWYGLALVGAQSLCVALLCALTWARRRILGRLRCGLVAALVVAFLPTFTLTPTFTMTATILSATAVVVFGFSLDSRGLSRGLLIMLGGISLAGGVALRWEAAIGVIVVFIPFIAAILWRIRWRAALFGSVAALSLIGIVHGSDLVWSRQGEWPTYSSYNSVRGQLHGTEQFENAIRSPDDPEMSAALREIGWTTDDLALFNLWMFDDPVVYSKAHLQRLVSVTGGSQYTSSFGDSVERVFEDRTALFGLLAACLAVAVAAERWRRVVLICVQAAWAMTVYTAIASRLRFPDRVALPSMFALGVILVVGFRVVAERGPLIARRRIRGVWWCENVAFVAIAALVFGPVGTDRGPVALSRANQVGLDRLEGQLAILDQVNPNGRFVSFGGGIDEASVDPLASADRSRSRQVLEVGWPTFSPLYQERKAEFGFDGDLLTALVEHDEVYLVAPPSVIPILQRVYQRRLGIRVTVDQKGVLGNGEEIFLIRRS